MLWIKMTMQSVDCLLVFMQKIMQALGNFQQSAFSIVIEARTTKLLRE
jgi:hypothetical protein